MSNYGIITIKHLKETKNNATVGSEGHFDNEIDIAGLESFPNIDIAEPTAVQETVDGGDSQ